MGHAKDSGGVWGHSSSIGANSYIIFAVSEDIATNKAFMGWAAGWKIGLKPLLGCYKGKTEQSYIVNSRDELAIMNAGWLKGQESILRLGPCDSRDRRKATLQFLQEDGKSFMGEQELGVLVSVGRDEALACEAWTYDPDLKEYFITTAPDAIKLCPIGLNAANMEQRRQHVFAFSNDLDTGKIIDAYMKMRLTI